MRKLSPHFEEGSPDQAGLKLGWRDKGTSWEGAENTIGLALETQRGLEDERSGEPKMGAAKTRFKFVEVLCIEDVEYGGRE